LVLGGWGAQAQTPGREGDTWGEQRHPPTEAQLEQTQSAVDAAASRAKEAAESETVHEIYRQLMQLEHRPA
jgi:hypothetical protein